MPVNACCCLNNCIKCGTCCYAEDSEVTVEWEFAELSVSDITWTDPQFSDDQKAAIVAWFNANRIYSQTFSTVYTHGSTKISWGGGGALGNVPVRWCENEVLVWQFELNDSLEGELFPGSAAAVSIGFWHAPGDDPCCGMTPTTLIISAADGEQYGSLDLTTFTSARIYVSANTCCYDAETEQCRVVEDNPCVDETGDGACDEGI